MISDAQLATMRERQAAALPSRARSIRRVIRQTDSRGGYNEEPVEVATDVPIRIGLASGADVRTAGAGFGSEVWGNSAKWMATFAHDADIATDDLIEIGDKNYRVVGVVNSGEDWSTAVRAAIVPE